MKKKEKQWKLPKASTKKWLKALRSGKYKQGSGHLKDAAGKYCCLGVYAEINGCKIKSGAAFLEKSGIVGINKIPKNLRYPHNLPEILAELNDGSSIQKRLSFKGIAQWIERNVELV